MTPPGTRFSLRADIVPISTAPPVAFETEWYEATSPEHFWMQWRFRAFLQQLARLRVDLQAPLCALEIGGGHGILRRQLESAGAWRIDLADVNPEALNRCPPGRGALLYYDVLDRNPDLLGRYDLVFLFDVLEHIDRTRPFLEATLAHLRPGGRLLVNVPALRRFYSAYDVALGHRRRYTRLSLAAEFEGLPAVVEDRRYWGFCLLPLLALRALLMRGHPTDPAVRSRLARRGCEAPLAGADRLLRVLMRLETAIPFPPPLGTSILCACRRT